METGGGSRRSVRRDRAINTVTARPRNPSSSVARLCHSSGLEPGPDCSSRPGRGSDGVLAERWFGSAPRPVHASLRRAMSAASPRL